MSNTIANAPVEGDRFVFNGSDSDSDTIATLTRGELRIEFADIGEGREGYYDPEDDTDVRYLRLYVEFDGEPIEDSSNCTNTPVATDEATLQRLLTIVMNRIQQPNATSADDFRIRRIMEEMSWINPSWAKSDLQNAVTSPGRAVDGAVSE